MNTFGRYSLLIVAAGLYAALVEGCDKTAPAGQERPAGRTVSKEVPEAERDPNRLWCNEHGVYEDECYICHPELKPKEGGERKQAHGDHAHDESEHDHSADAGAALYCKEHRLPEAECGNCRPDALARTPIGGGLKVRFASDAATAKAGVATDSPSAANGGAAREFLGSVSFNRNHLAEISPVTPGVVIDVLKDVGDTVKAGEVLSTLRSPEIAAVRKEMKDALAEARLAGQTLAREQDLFNREISARKDLEEAQAAAALRQSAIDEARQHFFSLGLSDADIETVMSAEKVEPTLPVRAPFDGTIVSRNAAKGKSVSTGDSLFHIADLSTMWMQFSVPENALASVKAGTPIQARFEAYPGVSFEGEVRWIAPSVDPQTRLILARAELPNPQAMLKDGLFGRVTLAHARQSGGLSIPETAIQNVDGRAVVFRKLEADLYETRPVELGPADDGRVLVLAGLGAEDRVVTEGSYVVKSELLKSRLGAGCADH